ncbi:ABC transporter permease [Clostridium botulinum C]|uniref:ABC transporter permease n=2 Tax=Clostridium botulinum TaxID=1491 RepID=A0A9Q4XV47_CLOBO|nr:MULTISPECIES: ABC transporter permease [Clostridium]EGO87694.1 sugar ABC transporter permease [Clostridium botulinum C str. Stockholm]MCD3195540.1 ABC transporter permease [Clostridium botulinum C]MCD3200956.1 ABC transporter permease [Clostridium botulinum C]MCD3206364.1 ABC transporter permease [Clostridium botulinum C]MCD3208816.1 ABC transporter permease [Clostridium botulinum C]
MKNVKKSNTSNSQVINVIKNSLKSLIFPLIAVVVSIFVAVFFVMCSKGYGISQYFSALTDLFRLIWKGSFSTSRNTLTTISYVTPLLFAGIANAIAFKCGLFNIGVEGQFVIGMLVGALLGLIPGLNPIVHAIIMVIGGIIAGGIWAAIPGALKAKFGTNEVVNTIMMNYISLNLVNWVVKKSRFSTENGTSTPLIQNSAMFQKFDSGTEANISIFIAIIVALIIYWLLWKTTIGYEIRGVGLNPLGAEYGGINIKKNIILAMLISGAIAGIGGSTYIAGARHQMQDLMGLPGFGFDGIAVALLARSNPIGCIASSILFGALKSSSAILQLNEIPKEIVYLIQSIVIIFVATDYIIKYFEEKKQKGAVINE